jgi:hypothetical protein
MGIAMHYHSAVQPHHPFALSADGASEPPRFHGGRPQVGTQALVASGTRLVGSLPTRDAAPAPRQPGGRYHV